MERSEIDEISHLAGDFALEGGDWGAAFAVRSVAGNALLTFGLNNDCRMADQSGADPMSGRRYEASRPMVAQYCCRAIRAFL